jgi:hypothetical protein
VSPQEAPSLSADAGDNTVPPARDARSARNARRTLQPRPRVVRDDRHLDPTVLRKPPGVLGSVGMNVRCSPPRLAECAHLHRRRVPTELRPEPFGDVARPAPRETEVVEGRTAFVGVAVDAQRRSRSRSARLQRVDDVRHVCGIEWHRLVGREQDRGKPEGIGLRLGLWSRLGLRLWMWIGPGRRLTADRIDRCDNRRPKTCGRLRRCPDAARHSLSRPRQPRRRSSWPVARSATKDPCRSTDEDEDDQRRCGQTPTPRPECFQSRRPAA